MFCLGLFQMLTVSTERFLKIQREAPAESQQFLVQVTKYQAAQSCKVEISKLKPVLFVMSLLL